MTNSVSGLTFSVHSCHFLKFFSIHLDNTYLETHECIVRTYDNYISIESTQQQNCRICGMFREEKRNHSDVSTVNTSVF